MSEQTVQVMNRLGGEVSYQLPELRVRRVFGAGEVKNIPIDELNALWGTNGGRSLLVDELIVNDDTWVKEHQKWDRDTMPEYWWTPQDIEHYLLTDDLQDFIDTLTHAPDSVIGWIKTKAYQIPLTDMNKIEAIKRHTGFDVLSAIRIMKPKDEEEITEPSVPTRRRRVRKEG